MYLHSLKRPCEINVEVWECSWDCNSSSPPLADIVLFGFSLLDFSLWAFSQGFKTRLLKRGFHTFIRNVSSPLQPMWDLTIHPPWSPTSSLAHRSVSGFNTICNRPNPLLADIVLFSLSFWASPQSFKTHLIGSGFHTLIRNASFSSPTNVGSHGDSGVLPR